MPRLELLGAELLRAVLCERAPSATACVGLYETALDLVARKNLSSITGEAVAILGAGGPVVLL
jgi:hypothetical protein